MTPPRYRWQPTTGEIAEQYGISADRVVRFDHNTSPFGTDWAASVVAPIARTLNEYPGASYSGVREAAAQYVGLESNMVVPGAGIDEIIALVARAFLAKGSVASAAVPTYPVYEIASLQRQADFTAVSYDPGFGFPAEDLSEAAQTSDVTWLCVPNNPIGDRVPDDIVASVIEQARGVVVIDAAYAEFSGDNWAPWLDRYDNLIVAHTLSKGFGLAGLRVGFAVSSAAIADRLDSVRPPGSIPSMSAELAEVALREPQRMRRRVERILKERTRMTAVLPQLGLTLVPSETNFLLCEVGPRAETVAHQLLKEGLVVRHFRADHPLHEFLRFTVRAPHEDDQLIDALRRQLS